MTVKKLHHIGIIVADLQPAIDRYEHVLGLQLNRIEDFGDGLLRIAFFPLGEVELELIQPLKPGSSAWDFLQKNGDGVEHLAFHVDDVEAELERVQNENIPSIDTKTKNGAGDTRIFFLHQDALCGTLGEFVSEKGEER